MKLQLIIDGSKLLVPNKTEDKTITGGLDLLGMAAGGMNDPQAKDAVETLRRFYDSAKDPQDVADDKAKV